MKAMLLAAGLGKRLRPLTRTRPKPLLDAGGKPIIVWQLERLAQAGIREVVVNLHHLGEQISDLLGDGSQFGLQLAYSREEKILETGGGVKRALPLLGDAPFLCVNADIYIEFDYAELLDKLDAGCLGCLLMTANPPWHPEGDFVLDDDGWLHEAASGPALTYTGVAVCSPHLLQDESAEAFPMRRVFDQAVAAGQIRGIHYNGYWCDAGTEERLAELREYLGNINVKETST